MKQGTDVAELSTEDRNDLALASTSSLHFYERIRQVRGSRAMIADGTLGNLFLGSELGDLSELEATFLRSGDEMEKLLAKNPADPDVTQVLTSHQARRAALGL
jgi:hypothetical protein